MKITRILSAAIFIAAFSSLAVFAQGTRPAATPAATPAANVPAPTAKIGLLDVGQFYEETGGINRLVAAQQQVAREFKPRQDKIQAMQADINKRTTDLQALANSAVVDQVKVAQLNDELEQKKKEYQREVEDAQAAFKRRWDAVREPIEVEIGRAIGDFAAKRGITIVMNVAQLAQGIIWAAPGVEITTEFINEFNSKPAAPATTPARP